MKEIIEEEEIIRLMFCRQEDTRLHKHEFLEMVYVTQGTALHILNDNETVVKEGDYFIIDYGAFHKYKTIGNTNFEIVNVLFKPEIIDRTLVDCMSFQDLINNYLIRFSYRALKYSPTNIVYYDDDKSIYAIIQKLRCESERKKAGYFEIMRCYLIEIIIQTMRKISEEDVNVLYKDYSKHIIEYINENYMKHMTLTEISARLNFSLPYICKRFKSDIGVTFNEYLQKKRVEQSCRLIANTDKKISEIAELVGYGDVKFFNQVFKKHLKMTPREFKKLHKV